MTNAARPNDDLATLRHCSASLTVMPPDDLSSRLPEPSLVSRGRHSACHQPAVTFRVSSWWTCLSFPALLIVLLCPSIFFYCRCCNQCPRASCFQYWDRQKSVGDDTWHLMPDWAQSIPRPPTLLRRDIRPVCVAPFHWLAYYIASRR